MDKKCGINGQSLVEFSLVLPAAFFTVLLLLEFFFIVRTKLVLGFTADRIARAAAAPGSQNALGPLAVEATEYAKHFSLGPAWGIPHPAIPSKEELPNGPDYPMLVIHPLNAPPQLELVDISFTVFPKLWFAHFIHVPDLGAHVEIPVEPEVPES